MQARQPPADRIAQSLDAHRLRPCLDVLSHHCMAAGDYLRATRLLDGCVWRTDITPTNAVCRSVSPAIARQLAKSLLTFCRLAARSNLSAQYVRDDLKTFGFSDSL